MQERISDMLSRLIAEADASGRRVIQFDLASERWPILVAELSENGVDIASDPNGVGGRNFLGVPIEVMELPERQIVRLTWEDGSSEAISRTSP